GVAPHTNAELRGVPRRLNVLEAEAALDAQVAARDVVVVGARHLDDRVVLHVQLEGAADTAIGTDRLRHGLLVLAPVTRLAELVLGAEHERARRAHGDAVAAVDACRLGEDGVELRRDAGVEAAPGDMDGEGVLVLLAAGVDALVTEDALAVVADVELV